MPVYQIVGFSLDSPIELPNMSELKSDATSPTELSIRIGGVPTLTASQPPIKLDGGEIQWLDEGFRLSHPRIGDVVLKQDTIYWQQSERPSIKGFRTYLLNTLLPAFAISKEMLPLHISAVSVAGQAIAFQGNSGAGKSTLAAMLMQRGFPVITEDLGVIELNNQTATMRAGVPYFRLWKQSLEYFNETPQQQNRAWSHTGKFYQQIEGSNFCSEQQPIRAIYFLLEPEQGNEITIRPITGFKAAKALLQSNFFGVPQNSSIEAEQIFNQTMKLAHQSKCFELIRPKDFTLANEVVDTLINHWKTF